MPRLPTNYSNTIIYKLCCNDPSITDVYVGHTTNFTRRKQEHKSFCNNENGKKYNVYIYTFIRDNGGWNNWSMIEIEKISCIDTNDAKKNERKYIELLGATLNKQLPTRTYKEWCYANKDHLKEQQKEYQEKNKEHLKEQQKEYREKNKEHLKEQKKEYQEKTKEHIQEYRKEYHQKNKEKIIERVREWTKNNKEYIKERCKEYYQKNKEHILERVKEYQTRKQSTNP